MNRAGPFWEAAEGRRPIPRAAATLGAEVVAFDESAVRIEMAFVATEDFTNPMGEVLGGFLAAMLFDTVGPALLASLGPDEFQETLDLTCSFLRATRPGRIVGTGRVVDRVDDFAFLDATLADADGVTIATGTATARVVPLGRPD